MRKKPEIVENGQNGVKNKSSRDWFLKKSHIWRLVTFSGLKNCTTITTTSCFKNSEATGIQVPLWSIKLFLVFSSRFHEFFRPCAIGSGGLWSFQFSDTKLDYFCHQNECTKSIFCIPYFLIKFPPLNSFRSNNSVY